MSFCGRRERLEQMDQAGRETEGDGNRGESGKIEDHLRGSMEG